MLLAVVVAHLPFAGAAWPQTPAPEPSAEEPQPSDDREAEITGIPFPALEGIEEAVQVQLREEHSEALAAGRSRYARWVHIRGLLSLFIAVVASVGVRAASLIAKLWKIAG